jgi:hypothetical protein
VRRAERKGTVVKQQSILLRRAAQVFFLSLLSATLFCVGCSMHESRQWGRPQDEITTLLALGTYSSLAAAIVSVFVIVLAIVRGKN